MTDLSGSLLGFMATDSYPVVSVKLRPIDERTIEVLEAHELLSRSDIVAGPCVRMRERSASKFPSPNDDNPNPKPSNPNKWAPRC